jgi:hypothetical protein
MRYKACLLWLFVFNCVAFAQPVAFGVKGGVPLTDLLEASTTNWTEWNSYGWYTSQSYSTNTKRYALGPMVEVRLPLRLSLEFDALYKHFDYDHDTFIVSESNGNVIYSDQYQKVAVSRWGFPLLLKYRPWKRQPSPFIAAGPSINYISRTDQAIESTTEIIIPSSAPGRIPPQESYSQTITSSSAKPVDLVRTCTGGIAAALGAEFRILRIRVSPEIRYTRWLNPNFMSFYPQTESEPSTLALRSRQDQIEGLLGGGFLTSENGPLYG